MDKQENFQQNFSLKGYVSIQIGLYFLAAAFVIKNILDGFLIDENPLGNLSPQILEILIIAIVFFTILFSSLALFYKGRRKAKKENYKLWNSKTKATFWKFTISFSMLFLALIILSAQGYLDYATPVLLSLYALSLLVLKAEKSKNLFVLSGICILLAVICFLIPNYWYSSIFILGLAHITYGIVVKS